ncbi:L-asparaginase [Kordiimonas sediminis]|uniref:L-asparaginase n=1 Tax=Kordiimonas sediminis TaxID=1735581 RepID=A0A919AWT6_9PROT|nr:asparaginase [Kordiimonas sediminis]GHF26866.1 L-asparaginase [Kordiimonas sediminis]
MVNLSPIQVFALGGTISMAPGTAAGVVPSLTGDDLISSIPGIHDIANLRVETLARLGSANISIDHLRTIAEYAQNPKYYRGIVVVQGTDTMEETAFLLRMMYCGDIPIVFTGAMVNPSELGADGPQNLYNAVVAATEASAGVYVAMDGDLMDALYVRKAHTSKKSAFIASHGPVGEIVEGKLHQFSVPAVISTGLDHTCKFANVALQAISLMDDGRMLQSLPQMGYAGLVIESYGAGHVSEVWRDKVISLATKIPVVLASRAGQGRVFSQTYGYKGAEIDLQSNGLISAGGLDSRKARLLLALLLGSGRDDWKEQFIRIAQTV